MSSELVLFKTDHCALCEEALELLFSMPDLAGHSVRVVDIASDDALIERYAERLPVLLVSDDSGQRELGWPFDAPAIRCCLIPSRRIPPGKD